MAEAYEVLKDSEKHAEYDLLRQYRHDPRFAEGPAEYEQSEERWHGDYSAFFESLFGQYSSGRFRQHADSPAPRRGQDVEMSVPVFLEETLIGESRTLSYPLPELDAHGRQIGETTKTLKVKIPAGVVDGERIRLKGQGVAGVNGGNSGDLYLIIKVAPHPLFEIAGQNLQILVPLAPWEAAFRYNG